MVVVVTRADKRRGRRQPPSPSPVKEAATEMGIPVTERIDDVLGSGAELAVVVAFGRLVRPPVLGSLDLVNIHFSLLPRWRGAAPVERALLAGDTVTGVSLMALEEGLDTGPLYARREVPIGPDETAAHLRGRLAVAGADLLVGTLAVGLGVPVPQEGEATYAAKIGPEDLVLRWEEPAERLHRVVRAGRAWTTWRGRRMIVADACPCAGALPSVPPGTLVGDRVATGEGSLRLLSVAPEGRKVLGATEWSRGARPAPGERLGG